MPLMPRLVSSFLALITMERFPIISGSISFWSMVPARPAVIRVASAVLKTVAPAISSTG